jgi:hypothetical protein
VKEIDRSVAEILHEAAQGERVQDEFQNGVRSRYREIIERIYEKVGKPNHKRVRLIFAGVQVAITAVGPPMAYYLKDRTASALVALICWGIWGFVVLLTLALGKLIPEDYNVFDLEIRRLKLTNICELLAARLALFDLLPTTEQEMAAGLNGLSDHVPDLNKLDEESLQAIRRSLDSNASFSEEDVKSSIVTIPKLNLPEEKERRLHEVTKQIAKVGHFLFGGKDVSAKIYLRVLKEFEGKTAEVLVAFSRYPSRSGPVPNGSSWAWNPATPALVCRARTTGSTVVGPATHYDEEFDAVVAICLPNRIGVLAITINEKNFTSIDVPKSTSKPLSLACRQLLLDALQ